MPLQGYVRTPGVAGKPPEAAGDKDGLAPPGSEGAQAAHTCLSDFPSLKAGEKESCRLEPAVVAWSPVLATPQAPSAQAAQLRTGTGTCRPPGPVTQLPEHLPSSCEPCGGHGPLSHGARGTAGRPPHPDCPPPTSQWGPSERGHAAPEPPCPSTSAGQRFLQPDAGPRGSSAGLQPGLVGRHCSLPPGRSSRG